MKKILAFAGSNSSKSINQKLAEFIAGLMKENDVEVISLTDYKIPMYGEDLETKTGFPDELRSLHEKIKENNGIILSVAEHNGSLTAYFKNILDWLSRLDRNFLEGKKIFLVGTSPGGRGGGRAIEMAERILPYFKGEVVATFPFPSFPQNFSDEITNPELKDKLMQAIKDFTQSL